MKKGACTTDEPQFIGLTKVLNAGSDAAWHVAIVEGYALPQNMDKAILFVNKILEKRDKMDKLKEKYDEVKQCSFSPSINLNSSKMILQKYQVVTTDPEIDNNRNDRNTELYEYSKVRNLKHKTIKDVYYSQYTHQPLINNNIQITTNFDDRQSHMIKKANEFQIKYEIFNIE